MREMRDTQQDTPPSSVNGDDIGAMDDEMYYEEVEEIQLEDLESMLEEQEEEDIEMEPPEDHSSIVFKKHVGSTFCCDIHPKGLLAVTGAEDDKGYVWSIETGDVVSDCSGHKDSVIFAGFSFDGAYVATGDMAGLIKVWEVNTANQNQWNVAFEYETEDLIWGFWHFGARVLIFGVESGDIYVFKIPSGEMKVLKGHNFKVECGKLFPDGRRLAAGYADGAVKIWELKTSSLVSQVPANVEELKVMAIDVQPDNNLVAALYSDGKVLLTTPNNGKVVAQLQAGSDLETLAFSQEPSGYLAIGSLTGAVSIWDTARQMLRHQCVKPEDESGVTKMLWIKNHLVTGCLDGSVRVYESRNGERKRVFTGHESAILDLCYNAEKKLILTTSDDDTARVFLYDVNNDND